MRTLFQDINVCSLLPADIPEVDVVDMQQINVDHACDSQSVPFSLSDVQKYALQRIMNRSRLKQPVVDGRFVINNDLLVLESKWNDFLKMSSLNEQVEWLLNFEYGRILPVLQEAVWSVEEVPLDLITAPNKNHVDHEVASKYQSSVNIYCNSFPCLIVRSMGPFYRLVDGYHRFTALKSLNKNKVLVFVAHTTKPE